MIFFNRYLEVHVHAWQRAPDAISAEATPNAEPWFGVKNRQLRKYLAAQEVNQLFRIPKNPRDYTPFDLPSEPLAAFE